MTDETLKSIDKATTELLEKAKKDEIGTVFSRAEQIKPCPVGVGRELL